MIKEFRNQYSYLSNFYRCDPHILYEGYEYASVEHGFQSLKALNQDDRDRIRNADHPGAAKKLGHEVVIRPDWDAVKIDIMFGLLKAKFNMPFFIDRILETGEEELVEGNWWNDKFWGFCLKTNEGENHLGKLLMRVRSELILNLKTSGID